MNHAPAGEGISLPQKVAIFHIMAATFLYAFNMHHSTVILPDTVLELDGASMYSWTRVSLVIAAICSTGLATIALQRRSFGSCYLLGYALFIGGTWVCAGAGDMGQLLLGRILQGLGGGMLFTLGYVLMQVGVGKAYWPLVLGLIQAMFALGSIAAPTFSLLVSQVVGWRSQLAIWSGLMLATVIALWFQRSILPYAGRANGEQRTPVVQILLVAQIIGLLMLITNASEWPLVVLFAMMLVSLVFLVRYERNAPDRILPKAATGHGPIILAMASVIILYSVVFSVDLYTPKVLAQIGSLDLALGGFVVCIIPVSWALSSIFVTMIPRHSGQVLGLSLMTILAGCAFYAFTAMGYRLLGMPGSMAIVMSMIFIGAGIGLGWPGVVSRMFDAVQPSEIGGVSRFVSLLQQAGTALGAVVIGIIARASGDYAMIDGAVQSAVIMGVLFALFSMLALPFALRNARP